MAYVSLEEEDAKVAIQKALELGMPSDLLTPLNWLKEDDPDFYEKYATPLLARYKC